MKVMITGARGFIGKNLIAHLSRYDNIEILPYDCDTTTRLDDYCRAADFVFHLAGVNRPVDPDEFMMGNSGFTATLLGTLKKHRNICPLLFSSSKHAVMDSAYGQSKKAGEDLATAYAAETGSKVFIYRLPNVFGKWCRPNYNSVIATFCNNIARNLPITINDPDIVMNLVYIDDVIEEFIRALHGSPSPSGTFYGVSPVYSIKLGQIATMLYSFKNSRSDFHIPDMGDAFTKKLYATYLSYLPEGSLNYMPKMNCDNRGSFTEVFRTAERGQVSINISKPGITKGNHWHHTKNEKFLVVSGSGVIRLRNISSDRIIEYYVSGDHLEIVDIPPGYTHNIENLGTSDLVTVMWANECFDPEHPDTYYLEV